MVMSLKKNGISKSVLLFPLLILIFSDAAGQLQQQQIDSLVTELAKAKDDTNKVNMLKTLGNEIMDPGKALPYALQGYELSRKLEFKKGIGTMAYIAGFLYQNLGNYNISDSFLNIAEVQFRQLNLPGQLAKIEHARGVKAYKQGNYWAASDFFARNVRIFEEIKDSSSALIAYQSLIAVLGQVKNHEKAVEQSKKVIKLAEAKNDTLSIHYSLQVLVTNLIYAGRMSEASEYITSLRKIAEITADQSLAADIFNTVGTYYYRNNNFNEAALNFEKASKISEKLGDKYGEANHKNSLGQAYLKLGKLPESEKTLIRAATLAKETGDRRAEHNISFSLSTYYQNKKDFRNAYNQLYHHLELKDSILKDETRNYTTYLEASFEASKKENEILRLKKLQQQKDFEISRRNTYLSIGAGLLAALIIILYLLKRNYSHKQKLARQQSDLLEEKLRIIEKEQQVSSLQSMINGQETERTRIAKDLHDGLGGIFSTVKMHYSTLQMETPDIKENPLYRKTLDLINNAADELRRVAHNMMPEVLLKMGLIEALQDFCNNINSGKLLTITLQSFGMDKRLGGSTEIVLYRIIQELINNIIKHAYATEALLQINREGNRLSLIIEDNGRGFDTKEAEDKRTMGITTIKNRVDYLNGRLTIDSRKDIGTTVMIDLLLNE
jgi:signal transduction histidine kinase